MAAADVEMLARLARDDPGLLPLLRQLEGNVLAREEYRRGIGIPAGELPASAKSRPPRSNDGND